LKAVQANFQFLFPSSSLEEKEDFVVNARTTHAVEYYVQRWKSLNYYSLVGQRGFGMTPGEVLHAIIVEHFVPASLALSGRGRG